MSVHAVIAVRGGEGAKSRCATVLDGAGRAALVLAMVGDMLDSLSGSPSIDHVHVVTPTAEVAALAHAHGAMALVETGVIGLNAAFDLMRTAIARDDPGASVILLPGDAPFAEPEAFDRIVAAHRPGRLVLVPAEAGGTGALVLAADAAIQLRFGPDSAAEHRVAAEQAGLELLVVDEPSLAFDIDGPADLDLAFAREGASRTVELLRNVRIGGEFSSR